MTITIATTTATDAGERGREFGEAWASEIRATWHQYERLFAAHSIDQGAVRDIAVRTLDDVQEWSEPHATELRALASGAGLDDWQVVALNTRSEVLTRSKLGVPGECSTVIHLPPGGGTPRTIQTWDWQHDMTDVKVVWRYQPRSDVTVKTFTEFGVLGKVGVNSHGLGLHFNLLQHVADGEGIGIPVHLVARRILDEATSVDGVEAIVRDTSVTASVALTVVAPEGDGFTARSFELSPVGVASLSLNEEGFVFHTNHFVDPGLASGERLGLTDEDTYARLKELDRRSDLFASDDFHARVEALVHHAEDGAGLCCHPGPADVPGDSWATQLVVGLELDRAGLVFQDGGPCTASQSGYVRF
ncbi:MAG TPA: C45 family peptidase [Actinomycetes bacterium]|nr:C45 family peptidase [Actinomycetes bacterium]